MKDCKFLFVVPVLLLMGQLLGAQNFEYKWQRVRMDSTYESATVYPVDRIIAEHQEQMGPLMKVVIYSNAEIEEAQPESALTNLVADMLIHAQQLPQGRGPCLRHLFHPSVQQLCRSGSDEGQGRAGDSRELR